jgi:hypothetical protein
VKVVRYGGPEPVEDTENVFNANITYNLSSMMRDICKDKFDGGIWEEIRRREQGLASDLLGPVLAALEDLRVRRSELLKFNAQNGWGDVSWAEEFLTDLAEGCATYPNAKVVARR